MDVIDLESMCRACMASGAAMEPLFESNNSQVFNLCTSLGAQQGDSLPQQICSSCLRKCLDWFKFKNLCEQTQEKYLNSISENLVEDDYVALNFDDIIALSPANSIQQNFIGSLSDEELASINVQEVDQTSDFGGDLETGSICAKCGESFKNSVRLSQHVRQKHASILSEVCPVCNKGFATSRALRRHRQKHETPDIKLQCVICDKTFKYATSLNLHIRKHQGNRDHVCKICSRAFFTSFQLETHFVVHQVEKPFVCFCSKAFKTEQMLANHRQRHDSSNKTKECEVCPKKFITEAELQIHVRTHTGQKPFLCECGKSFKTASQLSIHTRIHTQLKPFSCLVCSASFAVKSVLKKHTKIHEESYKVRNKRTKK